MGMSTDVHLSIVATICVCERLCQQSRFEDLLRDFQNMVDLACDVVCTKQGCDDIQSSIDDVIAHTDTRRFYNHKKLQNASLRAVFDECMIKMIMAVYREMSAHFMEQQRLLIENEPVGDGNLTDICRYFLDEKGGYLSCSMLTFKWAQS